MRTATLNIESPSFSFRNYSITGYLPMARRVYQITFPRFRDRHDLELYREIVLDRQKLEGKKGQSCNYNKAMLQLLKDLEFQLFELGDL